MVLKFLECEVFEGISIPVLPSCLVRALTVSVEREERGEEALVV